MRVLLVAAKRTFIDEHVGILEGAPASRPAIVDVDSFALGNAYELSGMINPQAIAAGKLVALVDIGASKTNINIMSDKTVSYFTREFYKGGDDLSPTPSPRSAPSKVKDAEALKRSVAGAGLFRRRRRRRRRAGAAAAVPRPSGQYAHRPRVVRRRRQDATERRERSDHQGAHRHAGQGRPDQVPAPRRSAANGLEEAAVGGADADRVMDCTPSVVEDICQRHQHLYRLLREPVRQEGRRGL